MPIPLNRVRVGMVFGRLVVTEYQSCRKVVCKCECGTVAIVRADCLDYGRTRSCGCLNSEIARARMIATQTKHGAWKTPLYANWAQMISRCTNPNDRGFHDYAGRGITVCDRWRKSFEAFRDDMGPKPSADHSIDRIDNNGNYEPGNVRWATARAQARNRRSNRWLTYQGERLTLTDWAARVGIDRGTLGGRLARGVPLDRALKPVVRKQRDQEPRR